MATEPLDTLQLKIESDASAAAKGLKELQGALKTLRTSLSRSKALDLGPVADEISRFASAVNSVNTDKIERLADAISTIRESSKGLSASMRSATKAVTEAQESASGQSTRPRTDTTDASTVDDIRDIGNAAQEAEQKVMSLAEKIRAGMYTPEGLSSARRISSSRSSLESQRAREERANTKAQEQALREQEQAEEQAALAREQAFENVLSTAKRVWSAVTGFARTSFRVITNLVQGIGKAFLRVGEIAKTAFLAPMKFIGNSLSKIYKTVTGLIRSVARIALYRAIRTAIKMVTQGLSEGIQNLYQWSLLVDRTFANSMDSIATSMQYLHNGFASMFSPLINYAAPIIEEVTNRLVDFFNVVQQIFATLTGASTWTKAVRVQKQYAEAVTDTGKAAEKAMHQVMAFDELNIINSPNDSGSPGSGNNTPDYGSMFVTEEVDTGLKSWVEEIKKFFESGDFRGLGAYVGEKLNALVNQWNAYAGGFNFGEKIKHALEALNGFLEEFDFYDLGTKVGDWLSGFLDGVTPEEIQRAIVNLINSAVSGASGLIDSLVSHNVPIKIGQAIGTSFTMIDWEGLTNLIRKIMLSIVDMINAAASSFIANNGPQKLVDACKEIGSAIGEAFATVNWANIVSIISSIFTGLVSMFSSAISSFVELGGPAKLRDAMGNIGTAIGEAFASIRGPQLAAIINAIVGGIKDMFVNAFKAFAKNNGWKEIWEMVKDLDWGTVLTLTLPLLVLDVLKVGTNLTAALLKSALVNAIINGGAVSLAGLGAALGIGALAATAAALTIGITLYATWKWANGEDPVTGTTFIDNHDGTYTVLTAQAAKAGEAESYRGTQEYVDSLLEGIQNSAFEQWGELTPGYNDTLNDIANNTGDIADSFRAYEELFGNTIPTDASTGGSSGGNTRNYMFNPFKGTLLAGVQKEIEQSDLSSKMEALSQRTGEAAKRGFESTNVPSKYKAIATASLDEFGKTDFTSGGASSGDEIKTGIERSNIRSKFSEEADKAANAVNGKDFTSVGTGLGDKVKSGLTASNIAGTAATLATNVVNAFGAIKPTAAAMGATLGAVLASNFKAHFIANAKSNLMIQTAAGKPITQAYVVPYAQGGYVQGGLFLAGEVAGQSEMVGSINGRTGVASGEEITGIREAVVSTGDEEASLLRQLLTVGQALLMKDPFGTPNSAAGRWIAQSQQAYKAVTG